MSAVMRELPAECDIGHFETHFLLSSDVKSEIKNEPPEDIDDRHGDHDDDNDVDYKQHVTATTPLHKMPSIRLTPTMKLLATPNAIDPKRKFRCPYDNCTKSYGKSSHLRSHLTWHTGIKPYCCQELGCGKSFTRSDELNRHLRTHTGEKPFECMQCAKKFSRSDHLTKHVATHAKQMKTLKRRAPDQPEQATTPNKRKATAAVATTTATTEPTTASSSTNKPLTEMALPPQGMSYDNGMHFMASLLEAAQLKHGRHVLEAENLADETVMQHMPIKIKLERPLDSEQYKVVNEAQVEQKEAATAAVEEDEDSDNQYDEDDVSTEEEDDVLPQPPQPTLDVAAAHAPPLPQSGAPLAVPRFDLVAAVSGIEEAQTIVSTKTATDDFNPERPYRCTECIKCFKRPDDLNRHLRTHTGEKPYACTQCEKRFNRSDHLKKHLRTHNKLL